MNCPACDAVVEATQDSCLECGESIAPAKVVDVPASKPNVARSPRATVPGTLKAISRRKPEPEVEPVRCPGCGTRSTAARCPECGVRLRSED